MLRRRHHIIISSRQGLLLPALLLTVTVGALAGSSPGTQTGEVGPDVKTPPPAPVQNPLLSDIGTAKDRVADFYKLCLPSKVDKLEKIFFRYGARGGHDQLLSDLREKYAGKTPEQILAEDISAQRQAEQARVQAQARRREAAIAAQQEEEAGHQEDAEDEDASSDDYEEFDEEFELAHIDEFGFFDDEEMCAAEECVAPYGTCVKNRYRGFDCQCAEGYQGKWCEITPSGKMRDGMEFAAETKTTPALPPKNTEELPGFVQGHQEL